VRKHRELKEKHEKLIKKSNMNDVEKYLATIRKQEEIISKLENLMDLSEFQNETTSSHPSTPSSSIAIFKPSRNKSKKNQPNENENPSKKIHSDQLVSMMAAENIMLKDKMAKMLAVVSDDVSFFFLGICNLFLIT